MSNEGFDYEGTVAKVKDQQDKNVIKINALRQAGHSLDGAAFANTKIDVFIQMFLDNNAQAAYALALETTLGQSLDEALSQVRQEQILGAAKSPGLIIPKG